MLGAEHAKAMSLFPSHIGKKSLFMSDSTVLDSCIAWLNPLALASSMELEA